MKKLNSYFPIWILMLVPPILFLTLTFNFVMVVIGTAIVFFLINKKKDVKFFFTSALKLWGATILLDIFSLLLMALPQIFYEFEAVKENLIIPLEKNPYTSIYSTIYMIFVVIMNILLICALTKKIILKKKEMKDSNKKISIFILIIFMIPYLIFIPSNKIIKTEYNSLQEYKGTTMKNKSRVSSILKNLGISENISSYVLDTHAEPYTLYIYINDIEISHQMLFERESAVLFNVIDDVNEVIFDYKDKKYTYTINSINKIFKNIKKKDLVEIYDRYKDSKFTEYIYLGRVNEFDVFDTSEFCELDHQLLFNALDENYYLSCTVVEQIVLYGKDKKINIKEALTNRDVTEYDLLNSTIDLTTEEEISKDESNS